MISKYSKVLCIPLALLAGGMLHAQDGGGVQVTPPYTPGTENQPSSAPPWQVGVETCPRDVLIAPRMFGANAADGAPWAYFHSANPSGFGTIRYDIHLRVTEERDEDDSSRYYETPDVNVVGRSDGFRFASTFDRTYQRDRRRDLAVVPPQDESHRQEDQRPPVPDLSVPSQSIITGWIPISKAFISSTFNMSSLHVGDSSIDEFKAEGIPAGGGIQVSLWGGIMRAGIAYVQGKVEGETLAPSPAMIQGGGQLVGGGDVINPGDPNRNPPQDVIGTSANRTIRYSGDLQVFELDLNLTALEGRVPLGDMVAFYASSGPALNLEYVQINVEHQTASSLMLAPGLFVEGGLEIGNAFRIFTRGAYNYGFGFGDIKSESVFLMFLGLEFGF